MAKIINITDKLSFDKNPVIVIRDTEIPVNDDAVTMLKIMDMLGDDESANASNIVKMAELIFTKEGKKKLDALKLNLADYSVVIEAAINLITGEDMDQGEAVNDTTIS